ncbi:hypothetical protein DL89DRAFT_274751 [Linderina pennispora]|uniref:chitin synthase n=1 Tax=Linderina pennispora TaxID=61395 RepID=A0A1Y1WBP4_9FUNG|nr:uncharacterized protein DL89DRAFT_274751 [Linderina pennispora]ORX70949.1 hypothetical protein DL89DRAFT_274751 [Linderina pennispora]
MLLAFACVLMMMVLVKFLTALQFGTKNRPIPPTQDEASLEKTINSLAGLDYEDKHKLIFIICDGNIVGSGNDRPTPRIVLDILGVDPDFEGHVVPFMVVAKVGTPEESDRSGNRGKRDSQIVLMSYFQKLEMYHQMRHIIGMDPREFEYILQVDADTEVMPDSLSRLIAACSSDQRINQSWTTMMQVYEYFISHHMAKAFESLFGSVTCLPGCFCMYRLRSADDKPLLIAKPVVEAYSELHVDTLHKKNLLSLGEDRYLTTLMMKHFPNFKLKFIQDAKCKTIAPEKWAILMSQRRRWINSTIHNLAELMFLPDMSDVGYISLILIGAIYGVQSIIFIMRREWQHVGWMIIYLMAYPLWSFVLPVYSFWHMDDFSWGNTRVVVGDGKRQLIVTDDKPFDPASIPHRRWAEYEQELAAAGVLNAPPPNMNPNAGSHKDDERMSSYSQQSGMIMNRVGSMYGGYNAAPSVVGSNVMSNPPGVPDQRYLAAVTSPMGPYAPYATVNMQGAGTIASHEALAMYSTVNGMGAVGRSISPASGLVRPMTIASSTSLHHDLQTAVASQEYMSAAINMGGNTPGNQTVQHQQQPLRPMSTFTTGAATEQGAGPSDEQLAEAVRRILAESDLSTMTKKRIRAQLAQEFNMDLTARKDFISNVVDRMLTGTL